ncbi:prephenate dehydrogenase [Sporolactobacillus vineae]|uniref:prephenate dehydrogenase n=1 Tax=Sporolactobacillus vineae TaxID=444463 RepID=UPI000289AFBB|nr:prephenate dehydrogenase [Sporolactobacillus vineae]
MKTIVVDGLGLIGGSLALAIRKKWPDHRIYAVDVNQQLLTFAENRGMIDGGFAQLRDIAPAADVIVLAAPVGTILAHLDRLAELSLKTDVLVTDVGSTKQEITAKAQRLSGRGVIFIGGHPMAGSHKTTVRAARADLFQSAYYFLITDTITDERHRRAADELQTLLSGTHVKWQLVSAAEHDRVVAQISHLPHLIASGLVNQSQTEFSHSPLSLKLAAGGFRSITRIASSDPTMWTDILLSSKATIVARMDGFVQELQRLRQAIIRSDQEAIRNYFLKAKVTRDGITDASREHVPGFHDLFLNIPDRVGEIAKVTRILEEEQINLINIHILEIREEIDGVLQLSFSNRQDLIRARNALTRYGFTAVRSD